MHAPFLLESLSLAQSRRGFCAPNPAVGAVLVREGQVIARGFHWAAGHPHAEVEVLRDVPAERLKGAILYVTLEPCCHYGRTPPCTELLIERGIEQVVFAYADPNPKVRGNGKQALEKAGISCVQFAVPQIDAFYESYAHWTRTRLPFVTAKLALTLDGKIALRDGTPYPVTGEGLREVTHRHRLHTDAILTTGRTVRADDPQLNCRLDGTAIAKPVYLIDARAEIPPTARVFQTAARVTIFTAEGALDNELISVDTTVRRLSSMSDSGQRRMNLKEILEQIGRDGVHDLWVEAGGTLFDQLRQQRLLQRALLYVSPKWLGTRGAEAFGQAPEELFCSATQVQWQGYGREAVCEVRW